MSSLSPVYLPRRADSPAASERGARTSFPSPSRNPEPQLFWRLIEQISQGHPRQTRVEIDRLVARRSIQRSPQLLARLHTLRSIAELDVARIELTARSPTDTRSIQGNTVSVMLQFVRQILPALSPRSDSDLQVILVERRDEINARDGDVERPKVEFTTHENEVFRLVATGQTNRQVANELFISEATVKKHLSSLMAKLKATNRTHAVSLARSIGELDDATSSQPGVRR